MSLDRRAESDNHARKEQCARAAAKNVGANFIVGFHRYISVLRRDPASRLTLREEGQVELFGETPNGLSASVSVPKISALCQQKK